MGLSTFSELEQHLLELNRAVIKLEQQDIDLSTKSAIRERIAFLQANRKRIAGSGRMGNMDHSFKVRGHKNFNSKLSDQYDDMYYEIRTLKSRLKLMETHS